METSVTTPTSPSSRWNSCPQPFPWTPWQETGKVVTTKSTAGGLARVNVQHLEGSCEHRQSGHAQVHHHVQRPVQLLDQLGMTNFVKHAEAGEQQDRQKGHSQVEARDQQQEHRGTLLQHSDVAMHRSVTMSSDPSSCWNILA